MVVVFVMAGEACLRVALQTSRNSFPAQTLKAYQQEPNRSEIMRFTYQT
jgi:hypothetical protein